MEDNFIDFGAEAEAATDPQNHPPEISDFPQTLVTEKIIFCIDIKLFLSNGEEESLIITVFNLLKSYFHLKKKICVKPPEFECLLIVDNEKIIHSYINTVKDLQSALVVIKSIPFEYEKEPLEIDKVFNKIAEIVELPDPECCKKSIPPNWVYHVLWLFSRNLYIPTMENVNPFDFLMRSPYFALDILYVYDNSSDCNCCEQISQALLGLNENGKGYFLSVSVNNKVKIFSCFAQFLGHPLIRSPQLRAKFNINELGPEVEIMTEGNEE